MDNETGDEKKVLSDGVFTTDIDIDDVDEQIVVSYGKMVDSVSKYTRVRNGWTTNAVLKLQLIVTRFQLLTASSVHYICTPSKLNTLKAAVNF